MLWTMKKYCVPHHTMVCTTHIPILACLFGFIWYLSCLWYGRIIPQSLQIQQSLEAAVMTQIEGVLLIIKMASTTDDTPITPRTSICTFQICKLVPNKWRARKGSKHYNNALAIHSGYTTPHYNLGNVLCLQRNFEDAAVHFRAAIEHRPRFAIIFISN